MGVDIHMDLINKNGKAIEEDLYNGRNYEWFDQLEGNDASDIYEDFPRCIGLPKNPSESLKKAYETKGYYGFNYFYAKEFIKWFERVNPHIDAGWVTTYEKWLYSTKGVVPDISKKQLNPDDNVGDWKFLVIENFYNNFYKLYAKLEGRKDLDELIVTYYFDH
jgi:hypothetical protein